MEWEVVLLDELFEFKNGVNTSKERYGNGVKFINISEILNRNYIIEPMIPGTNRYITKADEEIALLREKLTAL